MRSSGLYVAVCCLRLAAAVMTQPGRCLSWCMHPGPCGEDAGRPHSSRLVVRVDAPGRHRFELLEAAALRRAPLPALKAAALYFSSARLAALTLAANQPVPDYHPPGLAPALLCELQVDGSEAHAAAMPLRGSCTLAHYCCVPSLRASTQQRPRQPCSTAMHVPCRPVLCCRMPAAPSPPPARS